MNDPHVMVWFLATTAFILTVLTVGTLAAAELLPVRKRPGQDERERNEHSS